MAVMTVMYLLIGLVAFRTTKVSAVVQRQAIALKHAERGARAIPTENDLLASPSAVLAKMNNETEQLAKEISAAEAKSQEHVATLRAALQEDLFAKRVEVLAEEEKNRGLRVHTSELSAKVEKLHAEAKKLRANHSAMLAELAKLRADLNVSLDFLGDMLATSQGLDNDTEVNVLQELDSKDAHERAEAEKKAWRQSLQRPLSLLQESESPAIVVPEDTTKVLSSMATTLEDISRKRADDEHTLRAEFSANLSGVERQMRDLLAEQSQLNETMLATADMVGRLEKATDFLTYSNSKLHGKVVALRRYVGHLAHVEAKPSAATGTAVIAPSLLQIADDQTADELPNPLEAPLASYAEVGSRVASLQDNLKNLREQQAEEIKAKKSELDEKLHQQLQDTQLEEKKNSDLAKEIQALSVRVDELRESTSEREAKNEQLREDVQKMKTNVTIALEFLRTALNESSESPEATPELAVLSELDQAEAKENAMRDAISRMDEIEASVEEPAAALLQLRAAPTPDSDPTLVLGTLASSLETSAQEQSKRMASLQALFDQAWQRGLEHRTRVLSEQARLNATATTSKDLIEKLSLADDGLQKVGNTLQKHHDALSAFLRRVSARQLPADMKAVHVAPAPAKKSRKTHQPELKPARAKTLPATEAKVSPVSKKAQSWLSHFFSR